jgi:hypothetical protein
MERLGDCAGGSAFAGPPPAQKLPSSSRLRRTRRRTSRHEGRRRDTPACVAEATSARRRPVGRGISTCTMETTGPRPPCAATLRQAQGRQEGSATQKGKIAKRTQIIARRLGFLRRPALKTKPIMAETKPPERTEGRQLRAQIVKRSQVFASGGVHCGPLQLRSRQVRSASCRTRFALPKGPFWRINVSLPRHQCPWKG